jgi:hypothetical protein
MKTLVMNVVSRGLLYKEEMSRQRRKAVSMSLWNPAITGLRDAGVLNLIDCYAIWWENSYGAFEGQCQRGMGISTNVRALNGKASTSFWVQRLVDCRDAEFGNGLVIMISRYKSSPMTSHSKLGSAM